MRNHKEKTLRSAVWNTAGVGFVQFVQLGIGILLARILAPADFGLMAMLYVFVGVASGLAEGGLGAALIHHKNSTKEEESSVLFFNMLLAVVLYIVLWICAPVIARFYGEESLVSLLRAVGLCLIFTAPGIVHNALLSRALDYRTRTIAVFFAALFSGLIALLAAWSGYGVWSLVLQMLLNALLLTVFFWFCSPWRPLATFEFRAIRSLGAYGAHLVGSHVLATIFENLHNVLIGRFYSKIELGLYSRARSFQQLPLNSFSLALGGVLFSSLTQISDRPVEVRRGYRRALCCAMALAMPLCVWMLVVAQPLIRLVLSDAWLPAVRYFQVFCLASIFTPWHICNTNLLLALGRSDLYLRQEIGKRLIAVCVTLAMLPFGVISLAWAVAISAFLYLFLNTWHARQLIDYSGWAQFQDLLPYVLLSASLGVLVWVCLVWIPPIDVLRVSVATIIFTAGIMVYAMIKKDNAYQYMWNHLPVFLNMETGVKY